MSLLFHPSGVLPRFPYRLVQAVLVQMKITLVLQYLGDIWVEIQWLPQVRAGKKEVVVEVKKVDIAGQKETVNLTETPEFEGRRRNSYC